MIFIAAERARSNTSRILKNYIEGSTNSRIHHFLPECIAFNQSVLRHEQLENVTPCNRRPSSRGFHCEKVCSDLPVKRCEGDRA